MNTEKTNSKIHQIYEHFANSWEYNDALMRNDFDIDWLIGILDYEDYRKLENYIMYYCSQNDELLFRLGFQCAWSLFCECAQEEKKIPTMKTAVPK